jgi:uncharacterized NAD-dependent epimerase/dehydratase family protein
MVSPVPEFARRATPVNDSLIRFEVPFAVFLGDSTDEVYAKTGLGLVQWRRSDCVGQIRLSGCRIDAGVPDISAAAAKAQGVRSLIIGCAAVGGEIPAGWLAPLCEIAAAGIDIVAGLHVRLGTLPGLGKAAEAGGARLIDVRVPPRNLPVGTGRKRTGRRLLTVGTDCACGKKYTALSIDAEMRSRGLKSRFRATGQTGIMIAGSGMPIDAVVADFVTGAAEILSPANDADHWDIIEGQGSIFHPGFLQVTVGLLVGSQPDAFIVCHDPTRETISSWPEFPVPTLGKVIDATVATGRLTNPGIRCVGIALNTAKLAAPERARLRERYRAETGLPCVDPMIDGAGALVDRLLAEFPSCG